MIDKLNAARGDARGSVVWRSPVLRVPLLAIPLGLTLVLLRVPLVPLSIKLFVASIVAFTIASPTAGLLVVAALAPVGHLVAILAGAAPFNLTEAIATAFIAGWLVRGGPDRRGPAVGAPLIGWLFGGLLTASMVLRIWQSRWPIEEIARRVDDLARVHYLAADESPLLIVEGLALTAATVMLFRRRPKIAVTLPAVLTASGTVAAVMSSSAGRLFQGYHLTSRPDDWIAVAGYLVVAFCLAIGMLPRSGPRHRIAYAGVSALLAIGFVSAIFESRAPDAHVGIRSDLGIVGLGLFVAWVGVGLARSVRALTIEPHDTRLLGITVGVTAFVVASLASRALFQSEIAVAFWIEFGLMTALAGSTILNAQSRNENKKT